MKEPIFDAKEKVIHYRYKSKDVDIRLGSVWRLRPERIALLEKNMNLSQRGHMDRRVVVDSFDPLTKKIFLAGIGTTCNGNKSARTMSSVAHLLYRYCLDAPAPVPTPAPVSQDFSIKSLHEKLDMIIDFLTEVKT